MTLLLSHKAHILQTLNHSLTNSLIAITIIYFLSETYSILKAILLSTPEDKLSSDMIINHILVKEKSQQFQSTFQTTFVAYLGKRKGKTQDKGKRGQRKEANEKPKLGKYTYCKKEGHYKAKYRKIKHDLEKKGKGRSEKCHIQVHLSRKLHPCGDATSEPYKPAFHGGHLSHSMSYGGAATLQVFHLP